MTEPSRIRNFSIIAHIDHGKSTLADRLLEMTGAVSPQAMRAQVMDSMELERERGITIKAKAVRMPWHAPEGTFVLNLIDTPGHADFSYEVSRALAACEGALVVVDATQGVEAQTLAHVTLAQRLGLTLIPVINKIDLPSADVDGVSEQIMDALKIDEEPILVSAKSGLGVDKVLRAIVDKIPAPKGTASAPLRALLFDSTYSSYRGVIFLVRVVDGTVAPGMEVQFFSTGQKAVVEEVGHLLPKHSKTPTLGAGEVGTIICGIKDVSLVGVGETITDALRPATAPLAGYREAKPVVFAGVFPINTTDYTALGAALDKLHLEDSSFSWQPESSPALGFGFRLGFLGLLHMEILRERLEREFGLALILTSPNVIYRVQKKDGTWQTIDNPSNFPEHGTFEAVEEPYVLATIVLPMEYQEGVFNLLKEKRAEHIDVEYLGRRMIARYHLPLSEMVINFYDKLKSTSKGYASLDYAGEGWRVSEMTKLEILVHGTPVDALSQIVHKSKAYAMGRALCAKLKELIDRQMFEVSLQAKVNGRIVARETIPAKRKDVLAKCYGGDITRKRKLLSKQKEGKKRAKLLGSVEINQDAFLAALKIEEA